MAENSYPRCVRGPYRSKKRTPRQTKHNRNRKRSLSNSILNPNDMQVDMQQEIQLQDISNEPELHPVLNGPRSSVIDTVDPSDTSQTNKLFEDAVVTDASSEMAITTFISRHHLTIKAQGDLLDLLRLHLPSHGKSVASSVFTLRKYSAINPVAGPVCIPLLVSPMFLLLARQKSRSLS